MAAKKSNFWQTGLFKSRKTAAVLERQSVMFSSSSFLRAFQTTGMASEYRALPLLFLMLLNSDGVFFRMLLFFFL